MENLRNSSIALHTAHNTKTTDGTRAVPIYQSTSYVFENTEHAADLFSLKDSGYIYTRLNNPTNDVLEQRLAQLEDGVGAAVFASGTSAISTTLFTLLQSGDHIIASSSLYGGTYNLLNVTLRRFNIHTSFVDPDNIDNFENRINENTKLIFVESLGNPKLDIIDLEKIAEIAKRTNILLIVDNTVASPILLNPIKWGANIVIHSLTKYIGGHGTSLGGVVIDAGTYDWQNGKFPEFYEPSLGYHGLVYSELFENAAFIAKIRLEGLRDLGGALSPFNSFEIIQGLETLEIRIRRISESALELAEWLENKDEVAWVNYPGLKSSKYYELSQKYLPQGQSGIITFGLKDGFEAARKVSDSTELFSLLANIGDTKSLIIHPASTTHQQLSEDEQLSTGVSKDLIRLSIGLEDIEDLKNDLEQAFRNLQ